MGKLLSIVTPLHKSTQRDYIGRMTDDKIKCMKIAREFGRDFWDGDRRHGYGGYNYDGRWSVVAERLIETYSLKDNSKILDIGCGKGFLLHEFKKLLLGATVAGIDISTYAIANAKEDVKQNLTVGSAEEPYPFDDNEFDLVISITTLHNLGLPQLETALGEIERVGKNKYIVVEGYRSEEELFNLQCWALTCEMFLQPEGWRWVFSKCGYTGDYEFIYF
ncbi:SAM-dependent methyltransferase [hydrothermal vent metagenome]|uniref:SAM-dependent methyltransferase n=1 Tax=hydrothermal vent metagenome TaxID=652676 RepID=A0A3B1CGD5_9ZZZZ